MNSKAILNRGGALGAALLAHAAFAGMVLAAQPNPDEYLARLAPVAPMNAPADVAAGTLLAQRRNPAERPVVRTLTPTQLLRGTSAC